MAATNYEEATTLITAINHGLGLRNFVDPRRSKCKFACSLIYEISVICAISSIFFFNQIQVFMHTLFTIEILLYVFLMIIVLFGYIIIAIIGLYSSKHALALIKQINTVDEKLMKLGVKIKYRNLFRYVIINGFFLALGWIIIFALFLTVRLLNEMDKFSFISAICYVSILNISSITLYDFNTAVYWLRERFKQTNEILAVSLLENRQKKADEFIESIHNSIDTIDVRSSEKESQSAGKIYLIHEIRLVHLRLCYMLKMLNRLFEIQILSHVFMTLVYATVIFYHVYMELTRANAFFDRLHVIILYILDAVNHCAKIVVVSYNCEHATSQINKVIEIIHRSPLYEKDTDIKDEIVQFCLQISHMRIGKLQSASLWLNYSFIYGCLGFVLTNLIVMIQWSNDITKKESIILATENNDV